MLVPNFFCDVIAGNSSNHDITRQVLKTHELKRLREEALAASTQLVDRRRKNPSLSRKGMVSLEGLLNLFKRGADSAVTRRTFNVLVARMLGIAMANPSLPGTGRRRPNLKTNLKMTWPGWQTSIGLGVIVDERVNGIKGPVENWPTNLEEAVNHPDERIRNAVPNLIRHELKHRIREGLVSVITTPRSEEDELMLDFLLDELNILFRVAHRERIIPSEEEAQEFVRLLLTSQYEPLQKVVSDYELTFTHETASENLGDFLFLNSTRYRKIDNSKTPPAKWDHPLNQMGMHNRYMP